MLSAASSGSLTALSQGTRFEQVTAMLGSGCQLRTLSRGSKKTRRKKRARAQRGGKLHTYNRAVTEGLWLASIFFGVDKQTVERSNSK